MSKRTLLVLLLLLVPVAWAQSSSDSFAESVGFDGYVELNGSKFFTDITGDYGGTRDLYLEAEELRFEMDHDSQDTYLYYDDDNFTSSPGGSEVVYSGPGRVVANDVRPEHKIRLITEDAEVRFVSDGLGVVPRSSESVRVRGGEDPNRDSGSIEFGPNFAITNPNGYVEIVGDFWFNLDEWDGYIEHADGREDFWTGKKVTPNVVFQEGGDYLPGSTLNDVGGVNATEAGGHVEWQVAFVFVKNGMIRLEINKSESQNSYYMGPSTGLSSGQIELTLSSGNQKSEVFRGDNAVTLDVSSGEMLRVGVKPYEGTSEAPPSVEGNAASPDARFDDESPQSVDLGQPPARAAPTSTQTPQLPASDVPYWLVLLALPAVALAAVYVLHVRPTRRMHKLEDAYDLALYPFLVDNAPRLVKHPRFGVQASIMYTVALLEERGADEAEAHLDSVRAASRPTGPTLDFLMARIRAAQTRFDEAREHVRSCLEEEPAFIMEVRRHRMLEFLTRPPSDPGEGYA